MRKKVADLLGGAILGKKMPQRKKSRTNFRYFCVLGLILWSEGKDEKILGGARVHFRAGKSKFFVGGGRGKTQILPPPQKKMKKNRSLC